MEETRWRGRPVLAAVVRTFAYLVPIVCSVIVGAVVSRALPSASGLVEAAGWWIAVLVVSGLTVMLVDRVARRLLPLSALLGLSLAFPDNAPSRFRVAVRAGGTRRLEERIATARGEGPDASPANAAAAILELATLLNTHDRRTRGHSERVRVFADLLGEELQLPEEDRDRLRWAALLHDIGKLSVPASILNKPGKPSDQEWAVLQAHPDESESFLAPLQAWLGPWALAASQHHERWDGLGYPRGLAGQEISLSARIVSVADAYEVMTATRAYKRPMSAENARAELAKCAGAQFDPTVVRAFLNISLGRLRFAAGPLAWIAQVPFLGELPRLATGGATMPHVALAAQTSMASTALAVGATVGVALPTHSAPPPSNIEASTVSEIEADAGVMGAETGRSAGAAVVVTTTTSTTVPAETTTTIAPTAPASTGDTTPTTTPAPPRSESGAEHSRGRGTDERAQREAERRAEHEQRDRERAEREAREQAERAEREAREQAERAERDAQREAERAAREQADAERRAREDAERAAREAERENRGPGGGGDDGGGGSGDDEGGDDDDDEGDDEDD